MSLNIADLYEAVTDAVGDRTALVCGGERWTFDALDREANRFAHHLASVGVGPGSHVALHMRNRVEYVVALLACMKLRAVGINVNYRYVGPELEHLYRDSGSVVLVVESGFADTAAGVLDACPDVTHVVVVGGGVDASVGGRDTVSYDAAVAAHPESRGFGERSGDDHFVVYTGGTTGLPKGVVWRHEDFFFAALSGGNIGGAPRSTLEEVVAGAVANTEPTAYLLIPPLMHGAAIYSLLGAFLMGAPRVIMPAFDPVEVLRIVDAEKVTGITVVGDAIARPLADAIAARRDEFDLGSLRLVGSGGALFSPSVKDRLRELIPGVVIKDAFGASETGNDGIVEFGPDGTKTIAANPRMILVDDALRPIPPGSDAPGRIARLGHVPVGYWGDPVKTAETFGEIDGRRVAVLGDYGRRRPDGSIELLGRGSTCINTGGEKVYPEEVELALTSHPAVFDAVVAGATDDRFGERVAAVVQLRPDATGVDAETLVEHCRTLVAGYKIPRSIVFVDEVLRSPSGKPDYRWAKATVESA